MAQTKGIPSVPDVPTTLTERDIYRILEPLKRIIDIRQGQFDPLDRWVTQQDLIDAGLQTEATVEAPVTVVPPTQQYPFRLTGDVVGGPTTMGTGNPTNMSTSINLPNIVCIDGGDSTSTYPPLTGGPYGVANYRLETRDEGSQVVPITRIIDFVGAGVTVTSPASNQLRVEVAGTTGPPGASSEYCPGYTYTHVDTDTFRVDGLDVTNLFSVGRRLKFIDGANEYFGTISSRDYDTTSSGNTTINMTMEGGDNLTSGITEFCLTTGAAGWSAVAGDPFTGGQINAITSGQIGATKWWVAVGNNGKIATSSDAGVTWTARTSGTTENLNDVAYNSTDESFLAGGNAGVIVHSSNGTTWTADATSIPNLSLGADDGNNDIIGVLWWSALNDYWVLFQNDDFPQYGEAYSNDDAATWTGIAGTFNAPATDVTLRPGPAIQDRRDVGEYRILFQTGEDVYQLDDSRDGGAALAVNTSGEAEPFCYIGLEVSSVERRVTGRRDGEILSDTVVWDNGVTGFGSSIVRAAAESRTHDRVVFVGDDAKIGTADFPYAGAPNALTMRGNNFDPTAKILDVHWDAGDGVFIAVANNGQICRSTNGIN